MISINQEFLTYAIGIGTILSLIFTWYNSIRKPQQKGEVVDARFDEKYKALNDIVINMRDNHLHTLEVKLDKHIEDNTKSCLDQVRQMTRIETLIEQIIKK
jgi:hypothetical protein